MKKIILASFAATAIATFLLAARHAAAETIYGVTVFRSLITFDSATPGTIAASTPITGLVGQDSFESVLGIDFRPATGQLYALGNAPGSIYRLYTINTATGVATQVGADITTISATNVGFDFNPVVDRIRIVTDADQNHRFNPDTGASAGTDVNLAYAAGDANANANPNVVGAAYTNNFSGAVTTTLYDIDSGLNVLTTQNPPNNGTLNTVGPLGVDFSGQVGFDVSGGTGTAYASNFDGAVGISFFYTINLATGAATLVDDIGVEQFVNDIAVAPAAVPEPAGLALAAGALLVAQTTRRRQRPNGMSIRRPFRCALACCALAASLGVGTDARALTLDFVTVGNAGNAPDVRYVPSGLGAVSYAYRLGKFEITAGQYAEFLNAVAKSDPNGLYSTQMANPAGSALGCNIQRAGASGAYAYSVAADWVDRPVNWVSFWDAARFVNWLHNGQPTGAQGPGTTEDGAYLNVGNQTTFTRQPGARFFIPTEDEWFKAAYHDAGAGMAAVYFDYPSASDNLPGVDLTEATSPGDNANWKKDGTYALGTPYYRTVVGEFEQSVSPYGTYDQGGNVIEWVETAFDAGTSRGLRGSDFENSFGLSFRASDQESRNIPTQASRVIGFRVAAAAVPEPSALALALGAVGASASRGGRRRKRT